MFYRGIDTMTNPDKPERRSVRDDGRKGRRMVEDQVCPLHDLVWEHHDQDAKEHRTLVCGKIEKKADTGELKGLKLFVGSMVTVCCLIVGGIALWLRSDIGKVEGNLARVHQRISEQTDQRVSGVEKVNSSLSEIKTSLDVVNYRLGRLEDEHKIKKDNGGK